MAEITARDALITKLRELVVAFPLTTLTDLMAVNYFTGDPLTAMEKGEIGECVSAFVVLGERVFEFAQPANNPVIQSFKATVTLVTAYPDDPQAALGNIEDKVILKALEAGFTFEDGDPYAVNEDYTIHYLVLRFSKVINENLG